MTIKIKSFVVKDEKIILDTTANTEHEIINSTVAFNQYKPSATPPDYYALKVEKQIWEQLANPNDTLEIELLEFINNKKASDQLTQLLTEITKENTAEQLFDKLANIGTLPNVSPKDQLLIKLLTLIQDDLGGQKDRALAIKAIKEFLDNGKFYEQITKSLLTEIINQSDHETLFNNTHTISSLPETTPQEQLSKNLLKIMKARLDNTKPPAPKNIDFKFYLKNLDEGTGILLLELLNEYDANQLLANINNIDALPENTPKEQTFKNLLNIFKESLSTDTDLATAAPALKDALTIKLLQGYKYITHKNITIKKQTFQAFINTVQKVSAGNYQAEISKKAILLDNFEKIDKAVYFSIIGEYKTKHPHSPVISVNSGIIIKNFDDYSEDLFSGIHDQTEVLNYYTNVANDVAVYLAHREIALKTARSQTILDVENLLYGFIRDGKEIDQSNKERLFKIIDKHSPEKLYEKINTIDSLSADKPKEILLKNLLKIFKARLEQPNTAPDLDPIKNLLATGKDITLKKPKAGVKAIKQNEKVEYGFLWEVESPTPAAAAAKPKPSAQRQKEQDRAAKAAGVGDYAALEYIRDKALKIAFMENAITIATSNDSVYSQIAALPSTQQTAVRDSFSKIYAEKTAQYKKERADVIVVITSAIATSLKAAKDRSELTVPLTQLKKIAEDALTSLGIDGTFAQLFVNKYLDLRYENQVNINALPNMGFIPNLQAVINTNIAAQEAYVQIAQNQVDNITLDSIKAEKRNEQKAHSRRVDDDEDYSHRAADIRRAEVQNRNWLRNPVLDFMKYMGKYIGFNPDIWVSIYENQEQTKRRRILDIKQDLLQYAVEKDKLDKTASGSTDPVNQKLLDATTRDRYEKATLYSDYENKKRLENNQKQLDSAFDAMGKPAARGFAAFTSLNTTITAITLLLTLTGWTLIGGPFGWMLLCMTVGYSVFARGVVDFHEWDKNVQKAIPYIIMTGLFAVLVLAGFVFSPMSIGFLVSCIFVGSLGALSYIYHVYFNKNSMSFSPQTRSIQKLLIFLVFSVAALGVALTVLPAIIPGLTIWASTIAAFSIGFVINHYLQRFSIAEALKKKFGTADKYSIIRYYEGYKVANKLSSTQMFWLKFVVFTNFTLALLYASLGYTKLMELAGPLDLILGSTGVGSGIVQGAAWLSFSFIFIGYLLLTTGPMASAIELLGNVKDSCVNFYEDKNEVRSKFELGKFLYGLLHGALIAPIKSASGSKETRAVKQAEYSYSDKARVIAMLIFGLPFFIPTLFSWAVWGDPKASFWFKLDHYFIRAPWIFLYKCLVTALAILFLPFALFGMTALLVWKNAESFGEIMKDVLKTDENDKATNDKIETAATFIGWAGVFIKGPLVAKSCISTIVNFSHKGDPLHQERASLLKKANKAVGLIQEMENFTGMPRSVDDKAFAEKCKTLATNPKYKQSFEYWGYMFIRLGNALLNAELASDFIDNIDAYINNPNEEFQFDPSWSTIDENDFYIFLGAFSQSAVLGEIGRVAIGQEKMKNLEVLVDKLILKKQNEKFKEYEANPNQFETEAPANAGAGPTGTSTNVTIAPTTTTTSSTSAPPAAATIAASTKAPLIKAFQNTQDKFGRDVIQWNPNLKYKTTASV